MTEVIQISLPALIHRIGGAQTKQAKAIATQYHCELKRVRRSRNWLLVGGAKAVQSFNAELKSQDTQGFRHLIHKLDTALLNHSDKLEPLAEKLARMIAAKPNITLSELMQASECSLAEARLARFNEDTWA
jgi:phosphopantetheine adenylyltransferase